MSAVRKAAYPSAATINRVIKAAKDAGVKVGSVKVGADGTIHCLPAGGEPMSAYDAWKAAQG